MEGALETTLVVFRNALRGKVPPQSCRWRVPLGSPGSWKSCRVSWRQDLLLSRLKFVEQLPCQRAFGLDAELLVAPVKCVHGCVMWGWGRYLAREALVWIVD